MHTGPAIRMRDIRVERGGRDVLTGIDWQVDRGQSWVVLGRNGSGKTTLIRLASLYDHPTSGTVEVLGERLGRTDVRALRRRIGLSSPALLDLIRPSLTACDVVMTARYAALEPWWHEYTDADRERARMLLGEMGIAHVADHPMSSLSSGERQRCQLARVLMTEPELALFDEPTAGLDLAGREDLVGEFDRLAARRDLPMVVVTHHVEEIPAAFDHAALLDGHLLAAGPIEEVLTPAALSECFGLKLRLERRDGRWTAWHPG